MKRCHSPSLLTHSSATRNVLWDPLSELEALHSVLCRMISQTISARERTATTAEKMRTAGKRPIQAAVRPRAMIGTEKNR